MYHTSPNEIKAGQINDLGISGSCLFFSDNIYCMSASDKIYVYEITGLDCVSVSQLYSAEIIKEIQEWFNVDEDLAESLLDGSKWEFNIEGCTGEDSWWLQGKRGDCAVEMGHDGCKDVDEQGVVYIVPMTGREDELTLVETLKR